jgi:hypothetical protein
LGDGNYLFFFGAGMNLASVGAGQRARMSIQINADAVDDDIACVVESTLVVPGTIAAVKRLSGGGNNTVTAKYRSGDGTSSTFRVRWLIALKIGN